MCPWSCGRSRGFWPWQAPDGPDLDLDTGTTDLDDFSRQMAASDKDAYVRALLNRAGPGWELYHASALIGAEPPHWAMTTWQYEQLGFVSCRVPAHRLAGLCSPESGGLVSLGQFEAAVPGRSALRTGRGARATRSTSDRRCRSRSPNSGSRPAR